MMKGQIFFSTLTCILIASAPMLLAEDSKQVQSQDQERIYRSQLMTQEERNEYRNKIRTVKTAKEREKIRHEHHILMTV